MGERIIDNMVYEIFSFRCRLSILRFINNCRCALSIKKISKKMHDRSYNTPPLSRGLYAASASWACIHSPRQVEAPVLK